jgi:hypothetical protein
MPKDRAKHKKHQVYSSDTSFNFNRQDLDLFTTTKTYFK